jgi:integrase
LRKYSEEVSEGKDGGRWEIIRIKAFLGMETLPLRMKVKDITSADLTDWRNARMKEVSAGTVLREISLLSGIFSTAQNEWKWAKINPFADLKKPEKPDHREILITRSQQLKMLRSMGYVSGPCKSATQAVSVAFLVALRTGMRAGELCNIRWEDVHSRHIQVTGLAPGARKTSSAKRKVPLTGKASRLIESMRGWDKERVFGIRPQTLDTLFRRNRDRAGLSGFTFHDTRHTAATWIARHITILDLCKMFGWKDPKQAMVYYNPDASDIATQIERGLSRKSESSRNRSV